MKMHANEVEINKELVAYLVSTQFPEYADLLIEVVLPTGTDNAIYRLGDKLVVRLPRVADKERHIEKEYKWLPILAPYLPLDIPVPVKIGGPSDNYPFKWSIYSWLRGQALSESLPSDLNHTARVLAEFITALQKIDTTGAPKPKSNYDRGVPLIRRNRATLEAITKLEHMYNPETLGNEWRRALNTSVWGARPVWVHGDLDGRNMLVKNGRLSAVIDFGSLGVGDPAYDVMVAWKIFTEKSRQIFKEALGVDDATWVRSRGLVLSQAVMILSYYTNETNPVLVKEAQKWMTKLGF